MTRQRFRAIGNMLRSRLGRVVPLGKAAMRVEVIEEETEEAAAPLAVLPGMLERVKDGVAGHSTKDEELSQAVATRFRHAPVIRYVLADCLVHGSGVEYRGGYLAKAPSRLARVPLSAIRHADAGAYCMTAASHTYFGHWLTDACPTALLATADELAFLDERTDWPDTALYLKAFGLPHAEPGVYHVDELSIYSDFAQGQSKRARYATLKSRLKQAMGNGPRSSGPVYLRRGTTGVPRKIENEEALCDRLSRCGFDILDLATTSFAERYHRLAAASCLVTVDGSHVNHALFAMRPGHPVVTLALADRFTMVTRGVAHAMGLPYGCVVMNRSGDGYVADADEVMRTVELAAAAA